MELNAIYENGKLYFDGAFKLKTKRVPVRIVVDDESVISVDAGDKVRNPIEGKASFLLQKIHGLLGVDYEYIPNDNTDKEMLFEALEAKYLK